MKCFVDANIFLEVELQDKRKDECEKFFFGVVQGKQECFISDFILYAILIHLTHRGITLEAAKNFLAFIDQSKIKVLVPDMQTLNDALKIIKKYNLDSDDALVVSTMTANKVTNLVSFDRDFDRIDLIKKIEPFELISSHL
jgi:predicted nucleic acid-binding protein